VLDSRVINGPGKKVDFHTLVLLKTLPLRAAAAIIIIYCSALFLLVGRRVREREVRAGASLFSLRRLVANLLALRWA
jgi:hypothetical protein